MAFFCSYWKLRSRDIVGFHTGMRKKELPLSSGLTSAAGAGRHGPTGRKLLEPGQLPELILFSDDSDSDYAITWSGLSRCPAVGALADR